jgi:hypothetical protein
VKKKHGLRFAIASAFLAANAVSGAALAVDEVEPNYQPVNPMQSAQRLTVGMDGSVSVNGVIGNLSGPMAADVDLYAIHAACTTCW